MSSSATSSTTPPRPPAAPPQPPRTRNARSRPIGWGIALIGLGVLWLLSLAGVEILWDWVLPIALIVVGLLTLVVGRRGVDDGLIGLGVVLTVVALFAAVLPGSLDVSAGDRSYAAASVAELEPGYTLGMGSLTVDLRDIDLTGDTVEVAASVGMGELIVRLPDDVEVTGAAAVGMGEVDVLGRTREGISPSLSIDEPSDTAAGVIDLDLDVGLGSIEVTR